MVNMVKPKRGILCPVYGPVPYKKCNKDDCKHTIDTSICWYPHDMRNGIVRSARFGGISPKVVWIFKDRVEIGDLDK